MCTCLDDPCGPNPTALPLAVELATAYDGPGYAEQVDGGTYLIEDCGGSVYGVVHSRASARKLQAELSVIALKPKKDEPALVANGRGAGPTASGIE